MSLQQQMAAMLAELNALRSGGYQTKGDKPSSATRSSPKHSADGEAPVLAEADAGDTANEQVKDDKPSSAARKSPEQSTDGCEDPMLAEVDAGDTANVEVLGVDPESHDHVGGSEASGDAEAAGMPPFNMDTFSDTPPNDMDDDLDALIAEVDAERRSEEMKDSDSDEEAAAGDDTKEVTLAQLQEHKTAESVWMAIDGKVYDLTEWLDSHPGGRAVLIAKGGSDASAVFSTVHTGSAFASATRTLEQLPQVGLLGEP